ncbi:sensor histidine kinase [Ilyobacter polytropus]|uniref:histidine kinase n=1 Tax=Ilyobacter polytropus (strain ATCC 51220 / DSM 2926 / LMG 16218 / CuHBu1) TaxID=572544 RepID=E3H6P8_ILYPC|nr:ATP-binding protein [Ilyobacter polytropus]ADO82417.1 histidine kinase [Ilyobacter polytropus DSM 2926]
MIFFLEIFFVKINTDRVSTLYQEVAKKTLREDAILIKNIARNNSREDFQDIFGSVEKRFTLINAKGTVVYDSEKYEEESTMENHGTRPEVIEALEKGQGFNVRKSETLGELLAYYAMPYTDEYGEDYIIRVARGYDSDHSNIRNILTGQIIFFIILNIFIHLSYKNYLKRHLFSKVDEIRKSLETGIEVNEIYSNDDMWLVEFWKVVQAWQSENIKNLEKVNLEKQILRRVISSVDMSIVLINVNMEVILKNESLNYLYNFYQGGHYYQGMKYIEIINVVRKAIDEKKDIKEDVYITKLKKYLVIGVKYLEFRNQFIITIKDVTRNREMMEVQRNFISNISHELKTPLTNIKGYLIALEDAPEAMRGNFLKIVKNNVDKLENITMDFLNISKIENSKVLNLAPVSFGKIQEEIEKVLSRYIKSKEAEIIYSVNLLGADDYMRVDFDKLTTILKNLIENAIIYNDKKPVIRVEIKEIYDRYKMVIEDNGLGIPEEDIENIFERFYRVDKARTSNVAGTGLGLNIVAELVEICGGKIEVKSKEGKGSVFRFSMLK